MNPKCPTCEQTITNPDVITAMRLDELVLWDGLTYRHDGYTMSLAGGVLKVVAKSIDFAEEQGEVERESFIIVEYNGKFFRKYGFVDSYGESNWKGTCKPVTPTTKTIQVFE